MQANRYYSQYFRQMESALSLIERQTPHKYNNHRNSFKPIPVFSLISQLIVSMREFCRSDAKQNWLQFIYSTKRSQVFALLLQSWQFHCSQSLQCQLLSCLLQESDRRKLQLYLRLRKYISQLSGSQQLDNILLKYEDSITIIHRMFPSAIRKEISLGMKQIFIAYKVTDAKIYACVLIQFVLSIYDSNGQEQQSLMAGETRSIQQIQLSNFSTISKFNSNLHKNNQLRKVKRNNQTPYQIIETKFIPTQPQEIESKGNYFNEQEQQQNYYYSNSLSLEQQNSLSQSKPSYKLSKNSSRSQNKQNWLLNIKSSASLSSKKQYNDASREILIQESQNVSTSTIPQDQMPIQLKEMVIRNKQFKKRMLSLKNLEKQLSNQQEQGLKKTINIIHSSVVRNVPYK